MELIVPPYWNRTNALPRPGQPPLEKRTSWALMAIGLGAFAVGLAALVAYVAIGMWLEPPLSSDAPSRSAWRHAPAGIVIVTGSLGLLVFAWRTARRGLAWKTPAVLGIVLLIVALAR